MRFAVAEVLKVACSLLRQQLAVSSGTAFLAKPMQCLPSEMPNVVTELIGLRTYLGYVFIHANDLLAAHRARLLRPLLVF